MMRESVAAQTGCDQETWIPCRRGKLRLALINLQLRMFAKRLFRRRVDVVKLRNSASRLGRRLGLKDRVTERRRGTLAGLPVTWLEPSGARPQRTVLYLHGGGFVLRMLSVHLLMLEQWCKRLNARICVVDYRLAPEAPWPAAVEDCHHCWLALLGQGVDPRQAIIAGDSAGGNLVLATLQRIRREVGAMPTCAILLSPFLDFTLSGSSVVDNAKADSMFALPGVAALRDHYAPPEAFLNPDISPLFGEFSGLPPLLFQVGSTEMFLDDSRRAAARARLAGVDARLEIWEDMPHVFQAISVLPQAATALNRIAAFVESNRVSNAGSLAPGLEARPG